MINQQVDGYYNFDTISSGMLHYPLPNINNNDGCINIQCAKKVMSDSPGLVDSIFHSTDRQVKYFRRHFSLWQKVRKFIYRITINRRSKNNFHGKFPKCNFKL